MSGYDVVVAGRVCIDLYPTQANTRLEDVPTFSKSIGGSATNVAVAAARQGLSVAMLTRTGDDPFGRYIVEQFERFGVDPHWIRPVPGMQSVLTFCEMFPPDDFPLYFYRNPTAPDMYLETADLPLAEIARAGVFWATATGLSREPTRTAHHAAWDARGRIAGTVLDLDYRPAFWEDPADATSVIADALDKVSVVVGNREECRVAVGEDDPDRAADALLERGVELAIVKMGPDGVLARTREQAVRVAPIPIDVVNGLGAGDAFGGALCRGLLRGTPLPELLSFANAAGAIAATRFECSSAMPTTIEVEEFLAAHREVSA